MKLYKSYLLKKMGMTFTFFLASCFLIFTIVDLSIHGVRFFSNGFNGVLQFVIYYFFNFANHLHFFLPFTFLLSLIRVLLDLNTHHEIVALQMAGLSIKKILHPLFFFAGFLTLVCYANQEFLAPKSQEFATHFRKTHKKGGTEEDKPSLYSASLKDMAELIYQEKRGDELFDVYLIKNSRDLWHMKSLQIESIPKGTFVDHFVRNQEGSFKKIESFPERTFPELMVDLDLHLEAFIPIENRSISRLVSQCTSQSKEKKTALCYLHKKLSSPLLSSLALFLIAPFLMEFSRFKRPFIITAGSLFIFASFMTILEGMFILAENHVVPSFGAIWGPIVLAFMLGLPRFIKT